MAHSHYVVDLYYPADGNTDTLRRDVMRIEAASDTEATEEAIRISSWRHPVRFDLRAITNSVRTGDRLVYASPAAPEAMTEAPEAAAGPTPDDGQSQLQDEAT